MARREAPISTTPQAKLAALIKSARDAMRKDAGLSGDLDRIPQLAWLLFLKAFDGLEQNREVTEGDRYRPAIQSPFRWRDWAGDSDGPTGDALLKFVNDQLLPYLRDLSGTRPHDPRDVLASVFKETTNRMLSGYLLRDVINTVNDINFASSDDIHTMAHLYETLLREVRDAAGDSGEFYTPRPIIRFMVQQVDPKLGEIVLDPACGTGGFLVEALEYVTPKVQTAQQRRTLHQDLRGVEKKPLPFLLGMMNLVLHGVGQPNISRGNALSTPITQINKSQRVNVVLTNPPFGGEEEATIQANFPAGKRAAETALLFLQLIMRKLQRPPQPGRAAVVLPNTTLFYSGVAARIRRELITDFNLSAVVRLPKGVFEPYTDIETNLLFFDASGPSSQILYYKLDPPDDRKQYTKTRPLRFEELEDAVRVIETGRADSLHAWFVNAEDVLADPECSLDLHNPKVSIESSGGSSAVFERLTDSIDEIHRSIAAHRATVEGITSVAMDKASWHPVRLDDVLTRRKDVVEIEDDVLYKRLRIQVKGRGVLLRDEIKGEEVGTKRQFRVEFGQFVLSKIDARNGAFGIVPEECDGGIITGNFWAYDVDESVISIRLLHHLTQSDAFNRFCVLSSPGATNRRYLQEEKFLEQVAVVPKSLEDQERLSDLLDALAGATRTNERDLTVLGKAVPSLMRAALYDVFEAD